jgi:hypothetical protein
MMEATSSRLSPGFRQWAGPTMLDHGGDHTSRYVAVGSIRSKALASAA